MILTQNPTNNLGDDGDFAIANIKSSGTFFFVKSQNRWWTFGPMVDNANAGIEAWDAHAIHINKLGEINGTTLKGSPDDNDIFILEDSSDNFSKARVTISALRDTMYQKYIFQQICLSDSTPLSVTDGLGFIIVPEELDQWYFVGSQVHVEIASTSGLPKFNIHNVTTAKDMYTATQLTIDVNEKDSVDATTPAVIDTTNDQVNKGDKIRLDCDVAGTGTKGLIWSITFNKTR